jgi:hypothetical protein
MVRRHDNHDQSGVLHHLGGAGGVLCGGEYKVLDDREGPRRRDFEVEMFNLR